MTNVCTNLANSINIYGSGISDGLYVKPECFICKSTNSSFNDHHVIPKHCGGTDGPLVTLCSSCHDLAHSEAIKDYAKNAIDTDYYENYILNNIKFTTKISVDTIHRLHLIIYYIVMSENKVITSSNKSVGMTFKLTSNENEMLTHLQKVYGGRLSKPNIIKALIFEKYNSIIK